MRVTYYLFALVGIALAGCAAYVSVTGWAEVFAGSATVVTIIMAVIEAGKVTAASLAYRLREVAPKSLVSLLVATTVVTMILTSMGIYGFFSQAYQTSAGQVAQKEAKVAALEQKRENFQNRIRGLESRREQLNRRLQQTQERVDRLSQQYSERGWATDKQALDEAQVTLQEQRGRLSGMAQQTLALEDSVAAVNQNLTKLKTTSTEAEAKLSAVQFAADISGYPRQTIANIFILAIVFVFDPAAIAIIIATNVAAEKSGEKGFFEEKITENSNRSEPKSVQLEGESSEKLYEKAREGYEKALEDEGEEEPLDTEERVQRMGEFAAVGDPDESLVENVRHIQTPNGPEAAESDSEKAQPGFLYLEKRAERGKQKAEEQGKKPENALADLIDKAANSEPESDGQAQTLPEFEEEPVKPASFSLISWLQQTPQPIPTTHSNWAGSEARLEGAQFHWEAQDYIESELQQMAESESEELDTDSIREEVDRILENDEIADKSNNRYIIRASGGVDVDPSRESAS